MHARSAEYDSLHTPPVSPEALPQCVEALVLSSDRPVTPSRLAQALGLDPKKSAKDVESVISSLNAHYEQSDRSFRIERVAGGYRAMTRSGFAPVLAALHGLSASSSLSRAALETLSIVAYRQPITRARLEAIRGVSSGEVLRTLLDRRLVEIAGRADELGRPMLYGTTRRFLELFGLATIKDLPPFDEDPAADPGQTDTAGKGESKSETSP